MNRKFQYMVVIEKSPASYGAYVPDLPGCVAVGESREEALELIKEAIAFHLESLRDQGQPIPEPCSSGEFVEVAA
jgi:predicted RNase H-like HicB family nuclease